MLHSDDDDDVEQDTFVAPEGPPCGLCGHLYHKTSEHRVRPARMNTMRVAKKAHIQDGHDAAILNVQATSTETGQQQATKTQTPQANVQPRVEAPVATKPPVTGTLHDSRDTYEGTRVDPNGFFNPSRVVQRQEDAQEYRCYYCHQTGHGQRECQRRLDEGMVWSKQSGQYIPFVRRQQASNRTGGNDNENYREIAQTLHTNPSNSNDQQPTQPQQQPQQTQQSSQPSQPSSQRGGRGGYRGGRGGRPNNNNNSNRQNSDTSRPHNVFNNAQNANKQIQFGQASTSTSSTDQSNNGPMQGMLSVSMGQLAIPATNSRNAPTVQINGDERYHYRVLMDTGASLSAISYSVVKKRGLRISAPDAPPFKLLLAKKGAFADRIGYVVCVAKLYIQDGKTQPVIFEKRFEVMDLPDEIFIFGNDVLPEIFPEIADLVDRNIITNLYHIEGNKPRFIDDNSTSVDCDIVVTQEQAESITTVGEDLPMSLLYPTFCRIQVIEGNDDSNEDPCFAINQCVIPPQINSIGQQFTNDIARRRIAGHNRQKIMNNMIVTQPYYTDDYNEDPTDVYDELQSMYAEGRAEAEQQAYTMLYPYETPVRIELDADNEMMQLDVLGDEGDVVEGRLEHTQQYEETVTRKQHRTDVWQIKAADEFGQ